MIWRPARDDTSTATVQRSLFIKFITLEDRGLMLVKLEDCMLRDQKKMPPAQWGIHPRMPLLGAGRVTGGDAASPPGLIRVPKVPTHQHPGRMSTLIFHPSTHPKSKRPNIHKSVRSRFLEMTAAMGYEGGGAPPILAPMTSGLLPPTYSRFPLHFIQSCAGDKYRRRSSWRGRAEANGYK